MPQPATDRAAWRKALSAGDESSLRKLAGRDVPGASLLEIETFINGTYRLVAQAGVHTDEVEQARGRVAAAHAVAQALRRAVGWQVRVFDLALLRMVRRSGALSAVLGAGVSMGAGGPSWATLVQRLLESTLTQGLALRGPIARAEGGGEEGTPRVRVKHGVVGVRCYDAAQRARAEAVLAAVRRDGSATDVETLMQGAQLCMDLCGQELFRLVTAELYRSMKAPGPTHRAVAALAGAQHVPMRGPKPLPGWDKIITYNFDSLMSEALAEAQVPHVAYGVCTDRIGADPDPRAKASDWHVPILHLHGYTPRRLFRITHARFVFSTSQYTQAYQDEPLPMLRFVTEEVLANPVHVALYMGCSFADDAMNGLLAQAFDRCPGRYHYALLPWPRARQGVEPSPEEVHAESARYLAFGVRPVWFDGFDELPAMVSTLA